MNQNDWQQLFTYVSKRQLGTKRQREGLAAIVEHGSIRKAARALNQASSSLDGLVRRIRNCANEAGYQQAVEEELNVSYRDDVAEVRMLAPCDKSDDEVMAEAKLDPSVWRVKSHRKWSTAMKLRQGDKEEVVSVWNYHYVFERIVSKPIHEAIVGLFAGWRPPKPPKPKKAKDGLLAEVCLYDVHFGKLCWDEATGRKNYDLNEAAEDFGRGVDTLLERTSGHAIERWLLPVGNDFFQCDNWQGTTTRGTPVASDGRITKVFQAGFTAFEYAVSRMLTVAPVQLAWVPGNHDLNTSWHLFHSLAQRYRTCKDVEADLSHCRKRQYIEWGECVIGLQHGERMKPDRMVMIAATEFPDWGRKRFREIHCGHMHTRRDFSFLSASEYAGTLVRYLASLSGTDEWHFDSGFVGNKRAAECILWSRSEGPIVTASCFVD